MDIYLIFMEVKYRAVNADNYSCYSYYIIKIPSSPYTLQSDLNIDGQVISSGEVVCEGTYFFPIKINSHYYV